MTLRWIRVNILKAWGMYPQMYVARSKACSGYTVVGGRNIALESSITACSRSSARESFIASCNRLSLRRLFAFVPVCVVGNIFRCDKSPSYHRCLGWYPHQSVDNHPGCCDSSSCYNDPRCDNHPTLRYRVLGVATMVSGDMLFCVSGTLSHS